MEFHNKASDEADKQNFPWEQNTGDKTFITTSKKSK